MTPPQESRLSVGENASVATLLLNPKDAWATYVFAHGAGAGMNHAFMTAFAEGLAKRGVASLRFQFPSMEAGLKRPDPPAVAQATVRAACAAALETLPTLPLFAGGKSFGGRMTSQAQAEAPLPGVRGIVFVGFPLHPAGQPGVKRAEHLAKVACPLLFLQGTRDELAQTDLIQQTAARLPDATLAFFEDADHSFHVRKKSGTDDERTLDAMLDAVVGWMTEVLAKPT
jgi:predicted alpha/beta-hydrolase family hydrolase